MPIEVIYRCWNCDEEIMEETQSFDTFEQPLEDSTRFEMTIWNLCPNCISKEEDDKQSLISESPV